MAKKLEDYLKENPYLRFSQADLDMGRDNFGALEEIIQAKVDRKNATTEEAKQEANNRANAIRQYYGNYHGGDDGLQGVYSPTYKKPERAAQNENVEALFNKYNSAFQGKAPTWTPQYEKEIAGLLSDLGNREAFSYDMNKDPLYQQYRDQYIREGQRAMKDTAAQTAALTGGYGSTYGAIAAEQGYDNYLAQLNDRVPQLEQIAYGKYADEVADMYNRLGAMQTEENRLYGQYLDALGQYNTDRGFAYNAMQDAIGQNNHENSFERGIFESDRDFRLNQSQTERQQKQADIENALAIGDFRGLKELGYDTGYLEYMQQMEKAQTAAQLAKMGGRTGTGGSGKSSVGVKIDNDEEGGGDNGNGGKSNKGYLAVAAAYAQFGDSGQFDAMINRLLQNGTITEADYNRFRKNIGR